MSIPSVTQSKEFPHYPLTEDGEGERKAEDVLDQLAEDIVTEYNDEIDMAIPSIVDQLDDALPKLDDTIESGLAEKVLRAKLLGSSVSESYQPLQIQSYFNGLRYATNNRMDLPSRLTQTLQNNSQVSIESDDKIKVCKLHVGKEIIWVNGENTNKVPCDGAFVAQSGGFLSGQEGINVGAKVFEGADDFKLNSDVDRSSERGRDHLYVGLGFGGVIATGAVFLAQAGANNREFKTTTSYDYDYVSSIRTRYNTNLAIGLSLLSVGTAGEVGTLMNYQFDF